MNCPSKNCLLIGTLAFTAVGVVNLEAQLGPRNFFHAEAQAEATYDSAVFGNANSPDDTVFSVRPAISYERAYGIVHLVAKGGVQFNYFDEFEEENSQDIKSSIQVSFPNQEDRRYYFDARAGYNEFNEINSKVSSRIHGEETDAHALLVYYYSDRLSSEFIGGYQNTNIYDDNFIGNQTYEGATNLVYAYSERWDLLAGYRYRHTDIEDFSIMEFPDLVNDEELNNSDHAVYVGARGAWSEKLETQARIGWQQRNYDEQMRNGQAVTRKDNDSIFFEGEARWQYREDILFNLTAIQDYNTTVDNRTNNETSVALQMRKTWDPKISTLSFVGYDIYRFSGSNDSDSDDSVFVVRQGFTYLLWDDANFYGEASWMDRDSDLEASNYTRYTLKLGFRQKF
ncbi:MAG: hypothetical protein E1N59_285 [Puniceicoccaceae bacterium 5H]|nr:MAG: hypothetical protein E1N59_285 [Puniceicoccaceae bacterium 5H]